jgi:hypothetical protein
MTTNAPLAWPPAAWDGGRSNGSLHVFAAAEACLPRLLLARQERAAANATDGPDCSGNFWGRSRRDKLAKTPSPPPSFAGHPTSSGAQRVRPRVFFSSYIVSASTMPTLEYLIHRGPPGGDVSVGLECLRDEILRNGVPANSDGMVPPHLSTSRVSYQAQQLLTSNLCSRNYASTPG